MTHIFNTEKLSVDIHQELRRLWLAAANSNIEYVQEYLMNVEETHDCCGFYNVLDYCCTEQISSIAPDFIQEYTYWDKIDGASEQAQQDDYYSSSLVSENSSSEQLYDYYGTGSLNFDADYSAQIKKNECIPTNKNEHCVCQKLIDRGQGNGQLKVKKDMLLRDR